MKKSSHLHRKRNRLQGYDYSQNGYYFVTTCTKGRVQWFGEIKDDEMQLSRFGQIAKKQWMWLQDQYDSVTLDSFVIMPNHVHGIIVIENQGHGRDNSRVVPTRAVRDMPTGRHNLLSKTINAFKTTSSKLIRQNGCPEFIWQRSFHDHIIRDETGLNTIREYIEFNPLKWTLDKENPENF